MKLTVIVGVLAIARVAYAQDPSVPYDPAFSVDRLAPPPGPGTFLQVEDADIADPGAFFAGATLSLSTRPLVVRDVSSGDTLSEPVTLRTGVDLSAAFGIGGDWQLGLALPVIAYQRGDRLRGLDLPDADSALGATTIGDLRLSGKLRLHEPEYGFGQGYGVDMVLTLPTGDDGNFAGEAGVVLEMRLIGSYRTPRWAVAVNVGPRFRFVEVQFLSPEKTLGNEIAWGLAGSYRVRGVELVGELAGARGDDDVSPAEARAGVRVPVGAAWSIGAHVGIGIGQDIGTPGARFGLDVRWQPRTRLDRDEDEVPDQLDRCPDTPEDLDDHEDADGCPDLDDDGDGVPDTVDQCPNVPEDHDHYLDDDGCPEAGDGKVG